MPNNLQEDLEEILITGADKDEIRSHLIAKGYDPNDVDRELAQIPFVNQNEMAAEIVKSDAKSKKWKIIGTIMFALLIIGLLLKLYIHNKYNKPTYAEITITICNTSQSNIAIETNLTDALNSSFAKGGCLTATINDLPADYIYSDRMYIKISVNGKSQTFNTVNEGSFSNLASGVQVDHIPKTEGFFWDTEVQYVTYTITADDVAECK